MQAMKKKLKSEKGFVGSDITAAIIVVLLMMSLISVLFFNITKVSKDIERKSEAIRVATEVIEDLKSKNYTDVAVTSGSIELKKSGTSYTYKVSSKTVTIGTDIKLQDGYTCSVEIHNFYPPNVAATNKKDLVKVVTVDVKYKLANETKTVTLTTTITAK